VVVCRSRSDFCRVDRLVRNGVVAGQSALEPKTQQHLLCNVIMKPRRLIIVGGVAGGASAAARARRLCEECEIKIFERGPHVSFANCGLPYFVGGEVAQSDALLVQKPES